MNASTDTSEILRLYAQADYAAVEIKAREMTGRYPDDGFGWKALGTALCLMAQPGKAIPALETAARLMPNNAETWNSLGNACRALTRFEKAHAHYRRALSLDSRYASAWNNLGELLLWDLRRDEECLAVCREGLAACPDNANLANLLGVACVYVGQPLAAIPAYRRALEIDPEHQVARNNLLLALQYDERVSPLEALTEARLYGERLKQRIKPRVDWPNERNPERRLRVGLVSGDFGSHPVGNFLLGVLDRIDTEEIELFAYSNRKGQDRITRRIRSLVPHWRDIWGTVDERVMDMISEDRIDILVDLAGHTGNGRLPVFAGKPAPIQVAWLGYFATTGVDSIDYILADRWVLPPEEEAHFVEKPWRLPDAYYCYTPPSVPVAVGPLPALQNGHVTFGCFNNLAKVSDTVIACWSRILHAIPDARLFLKARPLADEGVRTSLLQRFAVHGIGEERLLLESVSAGPAYFKAYQRVDMALDPFPFPGGATTVDGLWMGVPVLTLKGRRFIGHQGETILRNAGLDDWVSENIDDYVDKAIRFAADPAALSALRAGLREQSLRSPIYDAGRFAGNLQSALRGMWRRWCETAT